MDPEKERDLAKVTEQISGKAWTSIPRSRVPSPPRPTTIGDETAVRGEECVLRARTPAQGKSRSSHALVRPGTHWPTHTSLEPWADPGLKPPLHENGKLCIYTSVLRSWSSLRELQGWNHPSELSHLDQGSGPFCCPRPCSINQTLSMADPREGQDLRPNIPQIHSLLLSFSATEPVNPSPKPLPMYLSHQFSQSVLCASTRRDFRRQVRFDESDQAPNCPPPPLPSWLPTVLGIKSKLPTTLVVVQSSPYVRLFETAWTAAGQAPLSFTISLSLLQLMSIEPVMPCNHLILCCPLLLSPSIFPRIRVFSNESALHTRWPKYWSFSFSPSNE